MQLSFDLEPMRDRNEPTLGFNEVSALLRHWPQELLDLVAETPYKRVLSAKPGGRGLRVLNIPDPRMREVVRIARKKLFYGFRSRLPHYASTTSASELASLHVRGRSYFQVDLKDAYANVSPEMLALAVSEAYHHYLTWLPTPHYYPDRNGSDVRGYEDWEPPRSGTRDWNPLYRLRGWDLEDEIGQAVADIFLTESDGLPQGSPISPFLFELACHPMDREIYRLIARVTGDPWNSSYRWGRYSDNIVISTREGSIPAELRSGVIEVIKDCGFVINRKKVHYRTGTARQPRMVGISLTSMKNFRRKLTLSRAQVRAYRGYIHRASLDPTIPAERIVGVITWVVSIYGKSIPARLRRPIADFMVARGLKVLKVGFNLKVEDLKAGA